MRLSTIIISIFLLSGLVVGFYGFVEQLSGSDAYNEDYDDKYVGTFDKTTELSEEINTKYNEMSNWTASKASTLGFVTFTVDALSLVKSLISLPFTVTHNLVTSIIEVLELPSWVTATVLATIATTFLLGFVAIVLRYRET